MTPEKILECRRRAHAVLRRPVPRVVLTGSAQVAAQFRNGAADVSKLAAGAVRPGWRYMAALQRMEGLQ